MLRSPRTTDVALLAAVIIAGIIIAMIIGAS